MKSHLAVNALVAGILLPSVCLSQGRDQRAALLKVDRAWSDLSGKGKDVDAIVSYWTDDATIYPSGIPPIHGKTAIRKFVKDSLATKGFHISWKPEKATLSSDGTMGYTAGTNSVTVPGPNGKLMTIAARYIAIWRRKHGGRWRCVEDITIPTSSPN